MTDPKLHALLFQRSNVSMERLRTLAAELKEAYDAQTVAEKHLAFAQRRQADVRKRIHDLLGDEAFSFFAMLRDQSGYLTPNPNGLPKDML